MHQYDPPDCVSDVTMKTSPRRTLEFTNDSVVQKEQPQQPEEVVDDLDQLECKEEFFLEDDDDDDDDLL